MRNGTKNDRVSAIVSVDKELSRKVSIVSIALGVTKAQLFEIAAEFYLTENQHLLPETMRNLKTSTEKK